MNEPKFLTSKAERGPERIPTEEEVLALMLNYSAELTDINDLRGKVERREADERGLYLLDVRVEGDTPTKYSQYEYVRSGTHGKTVMAETSIRIIYYDDGVPYDSDQVARFDEQTGEWKDLGVREPGDPGVRVERIRKI